MGEPVKIPPGTDLAAGSSVMCAWKDGTILPGEDTLKGAISEYGEPWVVAGLSHPHVCVKTTIACSSDQIIATMTEATAGHPPYLAAFGPSDEWVADFEIGGHELTETLEDIPIGFKNTVVGVGSAFPVLVGAAVLGVGLMAIGAAIYLTRKKSDG